MGIITENEANIREQIGVLNVGDVIKICTENGYIFIGTFDGVIKYTNGVIGVMLITSDETKVIAELDIKEVKVIAQRLRINNLCV